MAKRPTTTDITNIETSAGTINNNFDAVKGAFDNTISRDGSTPNEMEADLDLNGNDLLNVKSISVARVLIDGTPTEYGGPVYVYDSFDEFIAASTTMTANVQATIPSIGAVYAATESSGNLGQTNAGGQEFNVLTGDIRAWGAVGTEDARTPATSTPDISNLLAMLLNDSTVSDIYIPRGAWRLENPVNITSLDHDVTIRGAGMNETLLEVYQTGGYGIAIAAEDTEADRHKYSAVAEDFAICRVGAETYTGGSRPQTLRMERLKEPVMRRIDSYGGIGFALLMTRCIRPLIEYCLAHDSAIDRTGTDAIHFSRNVSPTALYNKAWNVGDDLLSFGSYTVVDGSTTEIVTTDVLAVGNTSWGGAIGEEIARSTASGVKLYGNISGATILGQKNYSCGAGGYYFADHNSPQDCLIEDVQVIGGLNVHCQGADNESAGAIRWRFNTKDNAGATSVARRITFKDVESYKCRSFFYSNPAPVIFGDHYLEDWTFENCRHIDPEKPEGFNAIFDIDIPNMRGSLTIKGFHARNSLAGSILIDSGGGFDQLDRLYLHDIAVDGFATAAPSPSSHGVWVREAGLPVDVRNLDVRNQNVENGTNPARRVILNNIRPDSFVNGLTGSGANGNQISGSYETTENRRSSATPSSGTWAKGQHVVSTASSGPSGWTCNLEGTFGTLGSVNATGASGDYTITVDTLDTLQVGEWIAAATGFSGGKNRIVKIEGSTLHLKNALVGSMSSEALSYSAPTFKAHADYV